MNANPCPTADTMGRLAAGELPAGERDPVLDHVLACPTCREELSLLSPLRNWADESLPAVEGRPAVKRPAAKRFWWSRRFVRQVLPLAAMLLMSFAALFYFRALPKAPETTPSGILRGEAQNLEVVPSDGAVLAEPPRVLELRQASTDSDRYYEVEVFDSELAILWVSDAETSPTFVLDEDVRALLTPGTYYWRILVEDDVERVAMTAWTFTVDGPL